MELAIYEKYFEKLLRPEINPILWSISSNPAPDCTSTADWLSSTILQHSSPLFTLLFRRIKVRLSSVKIIEQWIFNAF